MKLRKEDIELINRLVDKTGQDGVDGLNDIEQYKKILQVSAAWKVASNTVPDFSQFAEEIENKSALGSTRFNSIKWSVAASISILLLAATWLFNVNRRVEINTPVAQIQTVWLPDSSKVVLNAKSNLAYSNKEWENGERAVTLSGLAYFEVRKGSRFVVKTIHGQVAVLGTSFNVKALKDDFIVECITGKVAVTDHNQKHTIDLTPGLKVEKDKQNDVLTADTFDVANGKEWLEGTFNFRNQPLDKVWAEFERQFDFEIRHEGEVPRHYTGTFGNENMGNALERICKPMGLKYEIDSSQKVITINN